MPHKKPDVHKLDARLCISGFGWEASKSCLCTDQDAASSTAVQLAQAATALDMQTEALIHAGTRSAQLVRLRDAYRASALAVALRKLNGSYERRGRAGQLEAELEEAWWVAKDVARVVDWEANEKEREAVERMEVGAHFALDMESESREEKKEGRGDKVGGCGRTDGCG